MCVYIYIYIYIYISSVGDWGLTKYEVLVEWLVYSKEKTEVLRGKPASFPHGLPWDQSRDSAVTGQWPTARATARFLHRIRLVWVTNWLSFFCVTSHVHVRLVIYSTRVTNVNRVVVSTAPVLTSIQFYMCNIRLIMSPWQAPSNARTLSGRAAPCRPPPDRRPVVRPAAPSPHRLRSASPLASSWQPVIKGSPYHNQPSLCVVSPMYATSVVFTHPTPINVKIKCINSREFVITLSWLEWRRYVHCIANAV